MHQNQMKGGLVILYTTNIKLNFNVCICTLKSSNKDTFSGKFRPNRQKGQNIDDWNDDGLFKSTVVLYRLSPIDLRCPHPLPCNFASQ